MSKAKTRTSLTKQTNNKVVGKSGEIVAKRFANLTFNSPSKFKERVDEYFDIYCAPVPLLHPVTNEPIYNKDGSPATKQATPTQGGLARFLGFVSRQSLYDYENKPLYAACVKYARTRLSEYLESQAVHGKNPSGAIFLLNNLRDGWRDSKQIEHIDSAPKVAIVQFVSAKVDNIKNSPQKQKTIDVQAVSSSDN